MNANTEMAKAGSARAAAHSAEPEGPTREPCGENRNHVGQIAKYKAPFIKKMLYISYPFKYLSFALLLRPKYLGEKVKTLNPKRITTIAAGAALLGLGLAVAGPISGASNIVFGNATIISSSGQPLWTIVIGSQAKPSDGVAAANIAAALGNLAYVNGHRVTATINATAAASVLKPVVSSSSYAITGAQVWLNETGTSVSSGSYGFQALIGSVLNLGVYNNPTKEKSLQSSSTYSYPRSSSTIATPAQSAYSTYGTPPTNGKNPSATTTGGGIAFSSFSVGTQDNILRIGNSQLNSLLNGNSGYNGESEYIWVTGFPVFNQKNQSFQDEAAGGAYQVVFSSPIPRFNSNNGVNHASIRLLGSNWTIINSTGVSSVPTTQSVANGGSLRLAASLSSLTTVNIGQNMSSGPFKLQLLDIGQPNGAGTSPASINIYYNGALVNASYTIYPGSTVQFNYTGHKLFVFCNSTFFGLGFYQRYGKFQLYSNVFNISDGNPFNATTNPGWQVSLWWTNVTQVAGGKGNGLYSIVLINTSPTSLTPGQSLSFIESPSVWQYKFLGDTPSVAFDPVTLSTSGAASPSLVTYQNLGTQTNGAPTLTNITEMDQQFIVKSTLASAFSSAAGTTSQVNYNLVPMLLNGASNAMTSTSGGAANIIGENVVFSDMNPGSGNWINANAQLNVYITGYGISGSGGPGSKINNANPVAPITFTAGNTFLTTPLWNVTNIRFDRVLPGGSAGNVVVKIYPVYSNVATSNAYATLQNTGVPAIQYQQGALNYLSLSPITANTVNYQPAGQTPVPFALQQLATPGGAPGAQAYYTFTMNEIATPDQTLQDQVAIALFNTTAGVTSTPVFAVNYSLGGNHNNVTYISTQGVTLNSPEQYGPIFRTERGSKVGPLTQYQDTISFAQSIDQLQFAIGPVSANAVTGRSYTWYPLSGPGYAVGQATNIPNVSIAKVTANVTVAPGATYTISGLSNLTSLIQTNPKVFDTPVLLSGLSSTAPIAMLDTQAAAKPASNYILIGSHYVNSLSAQLESQYNIQEAASPSSQPVAALYGNNRILIAGYSANQTMSAANQFIQALYQKATV